MGDQNASNRPYLVPSASAASTQGLFQQAPSATEVRNAVRRAKPSRCPRAVKPLFVFSSSSGNAYSVPCGAYTCPYCGWQKGNILRYMALAGCVHQHNEGHRLRFITLTEDPKRPLDVPELSKAWNRLRTDFVRQGVLNEYCAVVETTKKGRPHLHAICTGKYIKQWKLSEAAERHGFGPVADIRKVNMDPDADPNDPSAALYIVKEVAGYVTKQRQEDELGKLTNKRRRPMRTSRGFYPGGMKRAKEELAALWLEDEDGEDQRDKGPWFFVIGDAGGTLTIRGKTEDGEPFQRKDLAVFGGDLDEQGGRPRNEHPASDEEGRRSEVQGGDDNRRLAA